MPVKYSSKITGIKCIGKGFLPSIIIVFLIQQRESNLRVQKIVRISCSKDLSKKGEAFVGCCTAGNAARPPLLITITPDSGVPTLKAVGTGRHTIVRWGELTSPLLKKCIAYSKITWKDLHQLHIKGLIFVLVMLVEAKKTHPFLKVWQSLPFLVSGGSQSWFNDVHRSAYLSKDKIFYLKNYLAVLDFLCLKYYL